MILLLNTSLLSMTDWDRGQLPKYDNFEIFKYTISSLAAVDRWSTAIFKIKYEHYEARERELEDYIKQEFSGKAKLELYNWRNESQPQWKDTVGYLDTLSDKYVWYLCNHDHLFVDYDHEALDLAVAAMDADAAERKSIYYSYWPERNRITKYAYPEEYKMLPCGTLSGIWHFMDATQIVSKPLLRHWWFDTDYGDRYLPRSDWKEISPTDPYRTFTTNREVCKHYDGYSHMFDAGRVPPMTIPPGFFEENIKIRYGYDDRREDCVNINPLTHNYRIRDPNGTDYKWLLEDIPLFWKSRITDIDVNNKYSAEELLVARNQSVRDYMTCPCHHHTSGGLMPEEEYIRHSMR